MSKIKEKFNFNINAAKLLIEKNYYASSVHCSYYSCFQLTKYVIKDFFNIDYNTLSNNIQTSKYHTHSYVLNFIANKIKSLSNVSEAIRFKNKYKDLIQFRIESDYENIEINYEKSKKALEKAQEIRQYLNKKFI